MQAPVIPIVGRWTAETPGTISLGQGIVSYGPPPKVMQAVAAFGSTLGEHRYGPVEGSAELVGLIEAKLARGELLAVAATDALELGIYVGELDAAICVNFPGTVASLRQMWGRAGRRRRGLAVYVAGQDGLDQFFCRHPDEFLERPVESAILDHRSEQIRMLHLVAAAYEHPLGALAGDDEVLGEGWREPAYLEHNR